MMKIIKGITTFIIGGIISPFYIVGVATYCTIKLLIKHVQESL